jgi:hypothetical protein
MMCTRGRPRRVLTKRNKASIVRLVLLCVLFTQSKLARSLGRRDFNTPPRPQVAEPCLRVHVALPCRLCEVLLRSILVQLHVAPSSRVHNTEPRESRSVSRCSRMFPPANSCHTVLRPTASYNRPQVDMSLFSYSKKVWRGTARSYHPRSIRPSCSAHARIHFGLTLHRDSPLRSGPAERPSPPRSMLLASTAPRHHPDRLPREENVQLPACSCPHPHLAKTLDLPAAGQLRYQPCPELHRRISRRPFVVPIMTMRQRNTSQMPWPQQLLVQGCAVCYHGAAVESYDIMLTSDSSG